MIRQAPNVPWFRALLRVAAFLRLHEKVPAMENRMPAPAMTSGKQDEGDVLRRR
jgi:hypothetical protein